MNEIQHSISSIIKGYTIYLVTNIAIVILSLIIFVPVMLTIATNVDDFTPTILSNFNIFAAFSGMMLYLLIILAALVLVILAMFTVYNGLKKLSPQLDSVGNAAVNKLSTAMLITIISSLCGLIPLAGAFIALGGMIAALVLNFMGYSELRTSTSLNDEGREGAKKLFQSIVFSLIAIGCVFIPILGWAAIPVFFVLYWVYLLKGWITLRDSFATLKCDIPNSLSDNQ